jgi:hypothetical protein
VLPFFSKFQGEVMKTAMTALALILSGCYTAAVLTSEGSRVNLTNGFDSNSGYAPDPYAGKCTLVREEPNAGSLFDVSAKNYAAGQGANAIYLVHFNADKIVGKLHDCKAVDHNPHGQYQLDNFYTSCQNEFGATYEVSTFAERRRLYSCH